MKVGDKVKFVDCMTFPAWARKMIDFETSIGEIVDNETSDDGLMYNVMFEDVRDPCRLTIVPFFGNEIKVVEQ